MRKGVCDEIDEKRKWNQFLREFPSKEWSMWVNFIAC